jgi:hypothetical protein
VISLAAPLHCSPSVTPEEDSMKLLIVMSCFVALATTGCGGKADCTELGKTWCSRVKACGGTPTPDCENILSNLCIASTPSGCTEPVDVSACVSAANSESCDQVLAAQPPDCQLRCK